MCHNCPGGLCYSDLDGNLVCNPSLDVRRLFGTTVALLSEQLGLMGKGLLPNACPGSVSYLIKVSTVHLRPIDFSPARSLCRPHPSSKNLVVRSSVPLFDLAAVDIHQVHIR